MARILRGMLKEYEAARELWVKALADTAEARAALSEAGDVVKNGEAKAEGDLQFNEAVEGTVTESRIPKIYTYDYLTSKPAMPLTLIDSTEEYKPNAETRNRIISAAIENAVSVGQKNNSGTAVVYVDDLGTDVIVGKNGIKHGLDRRLEVNAPVIVKIGEILQNAIRINELKPRNSTISNSYVLIGAAVDKANSMYIVEFVVNRHTNEISEIDVLYSANAKKESAGINSPEITGTPATRTDSKVSISQLLEYVNRYYPDILSSDVSNHFGRKTRASGTLGKNAMFNEALDDELTMREVLTGALEGAALTEADAKVLERYRRRVREIDGYDARLREKRMIIFFPNSS